MRKLLLFLTCLIFYPFFLFASDGSDYDKAWEALHKNDRKTALEFLTKAMNNPTTSVDAYLTYIYVNTFNGDETVANKFGDIIAAKVKDANPYIYALWFNGAVLGQYGKKKQKRQLELLEQILNDSKYNGSLKAAAHYVKGLHLFYSNQLEDAKKEYAKMETITKWQLTGPFENLSGSGFYKSYGPLEHPEASADFKSMNNAKIQWFTPPILIDDGWVFLNNHIPFSTAVCYAQSWVYAPEDMQVVACAGAAGSIKVWINDALVLAESHEHVTELDCYKNICQLKKGYNRVLVQVGYTGMSTANFIFRFTDKGMNPIPGLTATAQSQPYTKETSSSTGESMKHFAEAFFEEKVKSEPSNFINYILLAETYLRNQKIFEARKTIETAVKADPDNSLLRFELLQCLLKDHNRSLVSQEVERLQEKDPGCYIGYKIKLDRLIEAKKYEEASDLLDEIQKNYGDDEETLKDRIRITGARDKMEETVKLIQKGYELYPDNSQFVSMMFNLKKRGYKDLSGATGVYEKFLKNNFDYSIYKDLGEEYIEEGKKEKGMKILNRMNEMFPYDADFLSGMAKFYFQQQDYAKALEYSDRTTALAPFVSTYWENTGIIQQQMGKKQEAIAAYKKALYYDTKRYETRKKLRELENKTDLYKEFPETDVYDLIHKSASKTVSKDYDYYYLLDEKFSIVHAEGAVEEYTNMVIGINNQKGIDTWKESYIPYNDNTQTLYIEKAEVVKKNGNKISAEKNDNELVFTSLEAGDAIVMKYKILNYVRGRLGREFWDQFFFSSFVPSDQTRYCLLVDKNLPINFKVANADLKPVEKDVNDYKLYTWEMKDQQAVKDESYMPPLADVGPVLHISTIKSWEEVAQWYSDISYAHTENEYELKEAYDEIFSGKANLTPFEKARLIYNYIEKNIRYSSVSFRQSNFVPQKAAVTLNTKLGDCKDLSSLFVSLASMAGLDARLVLVDTRDNGMKQMMLPSVEFNHCIVQLTINGKEHYLELTDNNLPFASLPNTVAEASSLIIPGKKDADFTSNLKPLASQMRTREKIRRTVNITTSGTDINLETAITKTGGQTSSVRSNYTALSNEKQLEEMEKSLSSGFKNPLKLLSVSFSGLDSLTDSLSYNYKCVVKNEIIEVGEMKMFKIPFGDVIATIDNFSADNRKFPVEYWRYEDVDEYETVLNVKIPMGKKFVEIPADQAFQFNKSTYSLKFIKNGADKFTVIRKAKLNRADVQTADYQGMKDFLNNIIKAESKYIVFK